MLRISATAIISGGQGESASDCLEICQNLELIDADLPTHGYRAAARALINDPKFKQLYLDRRVQAEMARFIVRQAE